MNERVPSGVHGLDELIEGGFLRGDIILVAGGPGSGKTIFSSQFVYYGASKYGEKGVYATFEEDAKTLKRNMARFGFDLEKLEEQGFVKIIDLEALKGEGLSANTQFILNAVDEIGGKRLVIDSLTAFLTACKEKFEYRGLMHLLYKMLKMYGITTIMTCSIPMGTATLGIGVEEFVADAIILLENTIESLELKTKFLIRKMRGTNHSKKYHNVIITDNGLQILPLVLTR